jgi:hypothetical protein
VVAHLIHGARQHALGLLLWTTTSDGRAQGRSVLLTGTTGGRRAWTVSMISALSMPCR